MFYVYLLHHDQTKRNYIGRTDDLRRRLKEHNSNQQTATKRRIGKWRLVYYEAYSSKTDAISREKRLKAHGSGKREFLKRITLEPKVGLVATNESQATV